MHTLASNISQISLFVKLQSWLIAQDIYLIMNCVSAGVNELPRRLVETIFAGGHGSREGTSGTKNADGRVEKALRLLIVDLPEDAFCLMVIFALSFLVGCRQRRAVLGCGVVRVRCLLCNRAGSEGVDSAEDDSNGRAMRAINTLIRGLWSKK